MRFIFVFFLFIYSSIAAQDKQEYHHMDSLSRLFDDKDLKKSHSYHDQVLNLALQLEDPAILMDAFARMAEILHMEGNFQAALDQWEKTISYAKNNYDTIRIFKGKGVVYDRMGFPDLALNNLLNALERVDSEDIELRVDILNDLGLLYRRIAEPERALDYFNKIEKIKSSDPQYFKVYINLGVTYLDMEEFDSALHYFDIAYERVDKENNPRVVSIYFNNMGATLVDMGKPMEAIPYTEKAIEVKKKLGNKTSLANSYNLMSQIYLNLKAYEDAEKYASMSLELLDSSSINNVRYNALRYLIEARIKQQDTTEILDLVYQTMAVRNVTYNQEKTKAFTEMAAKYELQEKQNELLQKNLDLQKAENKIEKQSIMRNALAGGLILTLIIIALIFFSQRRKVRDNKLLKIKNYEIEERNKQIRQMERFKSRFFANISHEFRTPLTLILGPIDEIREKVDDPQSRLYLGMMQKNAKKLLNQVNQLLDLSKLDSGQLKLQVVKEDIIGFVKGVTMCFESQALSRNIDLGFSSNQETCNAWFDKDCIEKIMVNLLSNAFKFTEGAGRVSVEMAKLEDNQIEIKVSDTGRGIDTTELDKIFERYYHTESDMQASSGIGLALVKELVELHHGSIKVRSVRKKGSNFSITLPLGKSHWKDASVFEERISAQTSTQIEQELGHDLTIEENDNQVSPNKRSVLVIEDNADVRLFIKESLKENFDIIVAENGETGLELGEELIPDLIVTDLMMDGIDGYEVVKQLKQNEKTSHIPIIMLTARGDVESKLKGLEIEADDFITKPFKRKELLIRISNLIRNREKLKVRFTNSMVIQPGNIQISSIDQAFVEKLLAAVEENIDSNTFGVEELAEIVGMSRSQLHRKLQAIAGQPPNQFIRDIRLSRAMELLKNNVGTVADIAYITGFSSPNYFSKCFNDKYGCAPGEIRKKAS